MLVPRDDDKGQQLLDLLHDSFKTTKYTASSVLAGLIISLGGSLLLFITFCIIRPRHNLIYAPKIRYTEGNKRPAPLGGNFIYWFYRVFVTSEETLIEKLGIDAAVFIRFERMLRNIFLVCAIIGCGVAIPVNIIFNERSLNKTEIEQLGVFGMLTPTGVAGLPFAAHIALGYVFNIVVFVFLWNNFAKVVQIRRKAFMSKEYQQVLFMRTLLVTEVPRKYLSEDGIVALLRGFKVHKPIQQINIGKNVKDLTLLLEDHSRTVNKLEKVLAKYLRDPNKLPEKRPLCKPTKADQAIYGKKTDAIDYYINRSMRLEKQIMAAREAIDNHNCLPYALVSYNSQEDCHVVAKHAGVGRKAKMSIQLAPRPEDIIWNNMVLSYGERASKQFFGNLFYAAIMVLWIVPNAFIGCFLTNLSRIGQLWGGFNTFMEQYRTLFSILQGFLAPVVTTLVFMIMPTLLRRMSQWQGRITKTEREHDVTLKLYAFFFFNNFFVLTIINVAWSIGAMIVQLVKHESFSLKDAVEKVGDYTANSVIAASSFWVMYLLRANLGSVLDLLQTVSLLWGSIQRYLLSPTPRELMLATAPQPFHYAAYYNWLLFYASIALAFTSIQPLVLPILAFYLCFDSVLKKYSLMYINVTKTESDGSFWPLLNNCMLFATAFGNLILLAVIWGQSEWKMAVAIAPMPVSVVLFKIITAKRFNARFWYFIPDAQERELMDMTTSMGNTWETRSNLEERYLNPAINKRLPVPMVHARAEPLLREVCHMDSVSGNDEFEYESNPMLPDSKIRIHHKKKHNRESVVNGKKFDIIGENELDYDHYREIEGEPVAAPIPDSSSGEELSSYDASALPSKEDLKEDLKAESVYSMQKPDTLYSLPLDSQRSLLTEPYHPYANGNPYTNANAYAPYQGDLAYYDGAESLSSLVQPSAGVVAQHSTTSLRHVESNDDDQANLLTKPSPYRGWN
ncbi:hypothetical protein TRVA0_007S00430 [Trichomonascus vanleenenianus]|uniref:uncharacterized protein n=1 Tax=Trichomonascus vanleenenianus TaxID=2268995 RepID=UPI003EC9F1D1